MSRRLANPPAEGKPSMAPGDHVYYHYEDRPCHGVVAAIGKDGFTTDSDGQEHKVPWSDFLGHRKRLVRRFEVVDRGEDGSIMKDEDGKHVFVHGSLDEHIEGDDPDTLTKSASVATMAESLTPLIAERVSETVDPLLVKAQIVREIASAGFEPKLDYIHDTFGDHYVYRQPDTHNHADASGLVRDALERLSSTMAVQFQGLAAAISLLADRAQAQDSLQQTLLAALTEARQPQSITLTMPEGFGQFEAPAIQIDNHIPAQPAPVVHVAPAEVHVAAPAVTVAPVVEPVINVPVPDVVVQVPARETVTTIERDRDGNISRAVQRDVLGTPVH